MRKSTRIVFTANCNYW